MPRFPIPDSRFPIPDSRFPIPDSRFPIPDSRFPIFLEKFQFSEFAGFVDFLHQPKPLICPGGGAAGRQHAHLVTPAGRTLRQLDGLGPVPLEIQAEGQP